jgi:8-hydroxy-5-deazaflavin:NADPH oxidoreductase
MRIAIIGAGNIGGTLTRRLAALGHDVRVANSRAPETLKDLAAETGATATTAADGPKDADLVIISVPTKASPDLPRGAFDTRAPGAPIVETNNYYPGRDGHIDEIENGMASSRWVSNQIGQPVIKAFNTINWRDLLNDGKPAGTPGRIALPVAGDDPAAKKIVSDLIDELGFDPVDTGGLDDSWRQEPDTPVYGANLPVDEARPALAAATPPHPTHGPA